MSDLDRILSEFMDAWEAGRVPDPDAYLERVAPSEQHELSAQIRAYLAIAPEPAYDEATWQRLCDDPAALRAQSIPLGEPEPWPSLLPRLRQRLGLSRRDVAARLGVKRPEKAERYLTAMEDGSHEPRRVTRSALARLAAVLGVTEDALGWTGGAPSPALLRAAAPPAAAAPAIDLDVLADLATTPADEWDDSDELFCGGR